MFKRDHHVRIAAVLQALDADMLAELGCLFGGGTAIAFMRKEFRESFDIDFLVSSSTGYRALREKITGEHSIQVLARRGAQLSPVRDVRVDQYGIRTLVSVAGVDIKFEIVHEGRIVLAPPGPTDRVCGVATLTLLDLLTTKLLANSDRWADDSVFSRELIDLAMLEPTRPLLSSAIKKATAAYGIAIQRDLDRAIRQLAERTARLDECMEASKVEGVPKALLWKRIRRLQA